jgi:hypothetical protein
VHNRALCAQKEHDMILTVTTIDITILRRALQADRQAMREQPDSAAAAEDLDHRLAELQALGDAEAAHEQHARAYAAEQRRKHATTGCTLDRCYDRVEDEAYRQALTWAD